MPVVARGQQIGRVWQLYKIIRFAVGWGSGDNLEQFTLICMLGTYMEELRRHKKVKRRVALQRFKGSDRGGIKVKGIYCSPSINVGFIPSGVSNISFCLLCACFLDKG